MASIHAVRLGKTRTSKRPIVTRATDVSNGCSISNGVCSYSLSIREVDSEDVRTLHVITLTEAEAAAFVAFHTRIEAEKAATAALDKLMGRKD